MSIETKAAAGAVASMTASAAVPLPRLASRRLLFVDGLHTREAVLADVHAWMSYFTPGCHVIFDDFLPFPEVRQAVRELRASGAVPGKGLIVGKMAAFGPAEALRRVPAPPGARLLSRLDDRVLDFAIKLLATKAPPE